MSNIMIMNAGELYNHINSNDFTCNGKESYTGLWQNGTTDGFYALGRDDQGEQIVLADINNNSIIKEVDDVITVTNGSKVHTLEGIDTSPCTDDEDYECYSCGNPTGRGYDGGQCGECLGEF
jgi:hypothetical protein